MSSAAPPPYAELRNNTWSLDDVELDSTVSALVAGTYFKLASLSESAPPIVFDASRPLVIPVADPDFAWDVEKTPGRFHTFLMGLARAYPKITPSAWLETLHLVQAMFRFTKDHPVIVNNFVQELELLWIRAFWNMASLYDPTFTEDEFHDLTDSRYARCLDPSTKLLLKRAMDLETAKLEDGDPTSWRMRLCKVYADWTVEIEALHPEADPPTAIDSSIAASFSFVEEAVEEAIEVLPEGAIMEEVVAMEILPSDLDSLADIEEALEAELGADIDIQEELRIEEVISSSMSQRVITNTPSSTASAPAIIGTFPDNVGSPNTKSSTTGGSHGIQLESRAGAPVKENTIEVDGGVSDEADAHKTSRLPPRPTVRTRPPFGSPSTVGSETSPTATTPEAPKSGEPLPSLAPGGIFPFIFTRSRESMASATSTSTGGFSSLGISSNRPTVHGSMLSTTNGTSFTTTISSVSSTSADKILKGAVGFSGSASSRGEEAPNFSESVLSRTRLASPSSSTSRFRSLVRRLGRRRRDGRSKEANSLGSLATTVPTGASAATPMPTYQVLGWDGKPMKPKGRLARLISIPKLYWELKMAERRGEA